MATSIGDPFGSIYRYVETATTAPGAFETDFMVGQTIGGVVLTIAMRLLIKNQVDATTNGIYAAQEAGAPLRVDDLPESDNAAGFFVFVRGGSLVGQCWECIGPNATVGSDPLVWSRVDAAGTLDTVRGGTGTTSLGGTNTLLYTPAGGAPIAAITTAASGVLVTSAGGVPSIASSLPPSIAAASMRLTTPTISDGGSRAYTIAPTTTLDAPQQLLIPKTTSTQTFVLDSLAQTLANKTLTGSIFSDGAGRLAVIDTSGISPGTVTLSVPAVGGTIATQAYVAGISSGISQRQACRAKTTGIILVVASGSGVGKTLTSVLPGLLNLLGGFDGVALAVGDRVLVDSALFGSPNASCGIYTVTNAGSALTSWVLTRATDADTTAELPTGSTTFVTSGATAAGTSWTLTTSSPTIDVTPTLWTQSGTGTSYNFAGGVVSSGNSVSIGTSPTIGTTSNTVFVNSSAVAAQPLLSSGTVGTPAAYGTISLANPNSVSGVLPVASGGTARTSFTTNALHYGSFQQTNTLASAVLATDSGGVPALTRTLPAGLCFAAGPTIASGAFGVQIAAGTLTANSVATLPPGSYSDTFAMVAATQVLSNKTLADPTISGSIRDSSGTECLQFLAAPTAARTMIAGSTIGASSGDLTIASPAALATLRIKGTTAAATITADPAADYALVLPPADGPDGYVLATNGAGQLSWSWRETTNKTYLPIGSRCEAITATYQTVAAATLPAITCSAADLAFTIGDIGSGGDARNVSVRIQGLSGTIYAEYTGVNASGQYSIPFLVLPAAQDLMQLQVAKSADGGACPAVLGVTLMLRESA